MSGEILRSMNVSFMCSFIPMQMELSHKKHTVFIFFILKCASRNKTLCLFRAFPLKISKLLIQKIKSCK